MTTNVDMTAARVVGEILAAVDSGDVDALCRRVTDDVRFHQLHRSLAGNSGLMTSGADREGML